MSYILQYNVFIFPKQVILQKEKIALYFSLNEGPSYSSIYCILNSKVIKCCFKSYISLSVGCLLRSLDGIDEKSYRWISRFRNNFRRDDLAVIGVRYHCKQNFWNLQNNKEEGYFVDITNQDLCLTVLRRGTIWTWEP